MPPSPMSSSSEPARAAVLSRASWPHVVRRSSCSSRTPSTAQWKCGTASNTGRIMVAGAAGPPAGIVVPRAASSRARISCAGVPPFSPPTFAPPPPKVWATTGRVMRRSAATLHRGGAQSGCRGRLRAVRARPYARIARCELARASVGARRANRRASFAPPIAINPRPTTDGPLVAADGARRDARAGPRPPPSMSISRARSDRGAGRRGCVRAPCP